MNPLASIGTLLIMLLYIFIRGLISGFHTKPEPLEQTIFIVVSTLAILNVFIYFVILFVKEFFKWRN